MAKEILTRCGYRCDLCLAYKENIEADDQRGFLSDTWHKLYGFRIAADEILCEGCISGDNPRLIDSECPVRPCVIEKGLENCSQCSEYPCPVFNRRKVCREDVAEGKKITRTEYVKCIKAYENKKRLDDLRAKNFPHSRLLNPALTPDSQSMVRFIGDEKSAVLWTSLLDFMENSYVLDKKLLFGGQNYGWAVQYKKGKKTVAAFYPERNGMTVLLVFGKAELEKIAAGRDGLSPDILDILDRTPQLHDGKWLWLRLEDDVYKNDVMELVKVKRKPDAVIPRS